MLWVLGLTNYNEILVVTNAQCNKYQILTNAYTLYICLQIRIHKYICLHASLYSMLVRASFSSNNNNSKPLQKEHKTETNVQNYPKVKRKLFLFNETESLEIYKVIKPLYSMYYCNCTFWKVFRHKKDNTKFRSDVSLVPTEEMKYVLMTTTL